MRVLHVIPAVASRYGGPSVAVVQMVRALRERKIDAEIVTTDADGPGRLAVLPGVRREFEGVPTTFYPRLGPDSLKVAPGLCRWLREHVRDWDLVHIHSVFAVPVICAGKAAHRSGVPYVVRPLGHLAAWSLAQKALRKRAFWWLGGQAVVDRAAALHFTSLGEMRQAQGVVGEHRGFVVPLGLSPSRFPLPGTGRGFRSSVAGLGDRPYILFLGRVHPKKGIEALIEGFSEAVAGLVERDWALVIAGEGEARYEKELRDFASAKLRGRAFWVGWLEGEKKAAALAEADLFALVSHQENFGISAFEAMAEGTPCLLGTGVDLAPEVAEAGACWTVEPDGGAVAAVLREILANADERGRRGKAAARIVRERFSWPAVADRLISEYEHILGEGRSGRLGAAEGIAAAC